MSKEQEALKAAADNFEFLQKPNVTEPVKIEKIVEAKKDAPKPEPEKKVETPKVEEQPVEQVVEDVAIDETNPVETAEEPVKVDTPVDTKELDELKQHKALYDQFISDPFSFIERLQAEAKKGMPQEPPLENRIYAIYKKYGFDRDNPLDPTEAFNNPNSDHAKCQREVQTEYAKEQFKQFQIQQNMQMAARQQEQYIREGNKVVLDTFTQLQKEVGATKEDYDAALKEINSAQNAGDMFKLIANYMKYKIMATRGIQKKQKTESVEKQLQAAKQKEIPPVPAGGKVASTASADFTDTILRYNNF